MQHIGSVIGSHGGEGGTHAVSDSWSSTVDGVNARYAKALQIKRFAVLPRDLSLEAGELTPTLKVKRSIVYTNHAAALAALYADGEPETYQLPLVTRTDPAASLDHVLLGTVDTGDGPVWAPLFAPAPRRCRR